MSHYLFNGLAQLEEDFCYLQKALGRTNEGHSTYCIAMRNICSDIMLFEGNIDSSNSDVWNKFKLLLLARSSLI